MDLTTENSISAFDILRQRISTPATLIPTETPERSIRWSTRMVEAFKKHWPEYLMEAAELGLFMFSACAFTVLLYHPSSPVTQTIHDGVWRRLVMGTAMGTTAIAIIFSPLGQIISFILMSVVLSVSNTKRLARWTGIFAGALVATYITIESPVSGMSMNPARTLSSAVGARVWMSLWIYFVAPPLGMLLAAEGYRRLNVGRAVACAKLHHHNNQRCIFRCNFEPKQ